MRPNIIKRGMFNFLKAHNVEHVLAEPKEVKPKEGHEIHFPVHLETTIKLIKQNLFPEGTKPDSVKSFLDCTLGTGGHSKTLLQTFPNLYVLGIDLDKRMIDYVNQNTKQTLKEEEIKRFAAQNHNFTQINKLSPVMAFPDEFHRREKFDCFLADLGYNSIQLEGEEWGLAYNSNNLLDMRYDKETMKLSAADLLNTSPIYELEEIFSKFGEEPAANFISKLIVKERKKKKIETAQELKDILFNNMNPRTDKYKVLMRIFQALRITINAELQNLETFMENSFDPLKENGIGMIITFHSLERQIVVNHLKELKKKQKVKILELNLPPSDQEITLNRKSKSAHLHCFKKISPN